MTTRRDLWQAALATAAFSFVPVLANAAGKPVIVRVKFTFARNGMPLLPLMIDGKGPYKFLLDTGMFAPGIRESLAKELKLHSGQPIKMTSLKGSDMVNVYRAENVVVGGGLPFGRMSFVGFETFPLPDADGLLPASLLTHLASQLDYENQEIRYYLNGAEMDLDGFERADAFFQDAGENTPEKVYVNFTLDGHKLLCVLDTGAQSAILIGGGYVASRHLWDRYKVLYEGTSRGLNGKTIRSRTVAIPDLAVGTIHLNLLPVDLADPKALDSLDDIDGLIGSNLLHKFTLAFTGKKELYLKPNAAYARISGTIPDQALRAGAPHGSIAFLYGEDRKILLPASVEGKPAFPFVFETGEAKSAIAVDIAEQQGIPALPGGGFDGGVLTFGDIRLPHLVLGERSGKQRPKALLGLDILQGVPVSLDFDALLMTFYTDRPPDLSGYTRTDIVRMAKEGGGAGLYVTVKLAGIDTVCRIDTGYPPGIILPPQTVGARNLWNAFPGAEDRAMLQASGRPTKARFVKMQGLDFSGFHIEDVPVTLVDPTADAGAADKVVDAVIGMGIIRRFNIVFDKDGAVWFKPNKAFV
jgi:hypothetical protein